MGKSDADTDFNSPLASFNRYKPNKLSFPAASVKCAMLAKKTENTANAASTK